MDARAIAHHGKEDGGGHKEEAERTKHDPIQGVGENLRSEEVLFIYKYCNSIDIMISGLLYSNIKALPSTGQVLLLSC